MKKVKKNAYFLIKYDYSYEFSCIYKKKVVILHAFSNVGQIVPGREGLLLTINS